MQNNQQRLPEIDGGLKELLRPQELPDGASRMDVKTIKNAIKKRIPGTTEECIVIVPFRDAIGIGISIEIMGRMFGFSEPARIGFNHKDLLNVLDKLETAIKKKKCAIGLQSSGFMLPEDILKN
jgi:hypothetical protein